MGLSGELEDLQALKRTLGSAQEVEQAKSRLDQILQLFIDAEGVSNKFKAHPGNAGSLVDGTTDMNR